MLLLGKSVLCTYAIYVDGRGTYAVGMVSDKNFASRIEFEFTECESSRAELGTASCKSSRAASCRVELWSLIDKVSVFPVFHNRKKVKVIFF